jgi:hypothetical protein
VSKFITPFARATERAIERYNGRAYCRDLCERFEREEKIVKKVIEQGLASGYLVSLYDGEETTVSKSNSYKEVMSATFLTDENFLIFHKPDGTRVGSVYLVYGNSGFDVISDYSSSDLDSFSDWMEPIEQYCDKLEQESRA